MTEKLLNTRKERAKGVRIYRPDSRIRQNGLQAVISISREIRNFRSHITTLFTSDFRKGYRGTVLGIFWNFVLPMVPISVYIMLVSLRIMPRYEGLSPAVYISFNVTIWFLLTGLIRQPIQVVKSKNTEMMKTAIPLSAAIVSSFAQLCFDTFVRIALVVVIILAMQAATKWTALFIVPIILSASIFCLGLGLLLSILNVIYRDIERVITILLQYGIFLSGVIFPLASLGPLVSLSAANPFNVFISSAREAAFAGSISQPGALAAWTVVGVILFLYSAWFFYLMEYRIRGSSE